MSGIEVAGLVLGAIPLVISALEHYESALDSAVAFLRWQRELSIAIQALWFQHTSYVQSIRLLLSPITTDEEIQDMMDDASHKLWKSEDIAKELEKRLGDAYKPYLMTIRQIEEVTRALAEKLDIQGSNKISQLGLEAIVLANPPIKKRGMLPEFNFNKRVKFTMKKQKVKRLLENLDAYNRRLDTFATKAEKLEEPYKAENKSKFAFPLRIIQGNAARLYDVLSRSWCSGQHSHSAGLLLEPRLVRKQRRTQGRRQWNAGEKCETNCFGISLLQTPSPKRWVDVEFRLVEDPDNDHPAAKSTVQVVISSSVPDPLPTTPYGDLSQLQRVTNLCSILQQPSHHRIGFCLDSSGYLRGAYPAQQRALAIIENGISLGDLMKKRQGIFSPEEMHCLCVTLTSSLLQLSDTPWLEQSWNKADIIFLRAKDGCTESVDVKHPYLTRDHEPNKTRLIRHGISPGNDCSKLLDLAVLLVEVRSGKPIEKLRLPEDLGPNNEPNEVTNLQAVRRWINEQINNGQLSFNFSLAISHCLQGFVNPMASLQNLEYCKTVEEQVLAPLEEEMNFYLFGPSAL